MVELGEVTVMLTVKKHRLLCVRVAQTVISRGWAKLIPSYII